MRSISGMLCDDLAGDALRCVPIPEMNAFRRPGRCRFAARTYTL